MGTAKEPRHAAAPRARSSSSRARCSRCPQPRSPCCPVLPRGYWKRKLLGRQHVQQGSLGEERSGEPAGPTPRSRASNGKRLLSVPVNQIGEIRGLFA